jgi:hypothetical protein
MTAALDYGAPADLFAGGRYKSSPLSYRRFQSAAEAIRYAIEDIDLKDLARLAIEFGGDRFEGKAIRALYDAPDYPRAP